MSRRSRNPRRKKRSSHSKSSPIEANSKEKQVDSDSLAKNSEMRIEAEHFEGPLPHPKILHAYNDILPGAAERILNLLEKQSEHRQSMEKGQLKLANKATNYDFFSVLFGQVTAFIVLLLFVGGGIYIIITQDGYKASIIGPLLSISGTASIIWGFINRQKVKDHKEKDE